MTREEKIARMAELRKSAEAKAKEYNDAMAINKFDDVAKINGDLDKLIVEYTGLASEVCFEECKNSEDPMIEAVKRLTFSTIATRDERREEISVPVKVIADKDKAIDPLKLYKYVGKIGANENWPYMVEKLNLLMTAQKAADLGIDPTTVNASYAMSKIAEEIDLGKTPTSKTNMLKTLQGIVSAMLGEGYKATSHDVNFLLSVYSRKSRKALTVSCANHKYMRGYLMEICHRIVLDKHYAVEYKVKKA